MPDKEEIIGMKVLIMLPIIIGILYSMFKPDYDKLQKLAVEEITKLNVPETVRNNPIIRSLATRSNISSGRIIINDFNENELSFRLNISQNKAKTIVDERNKRIFSDWNDFKVRVPSLANKVEDFIISGACISGE